MYAVVAVLATALISSTVGLKACDNSIIEKLKTVGDCYTGGVPPKDFLIADIYKVIRVSEGEIPVGTDCTTINGLNSISQIDYYDSQGDSESCMSQRTVQGAYYQETELRQCTHNTEGRTFKIYPIHHESEVYSYYKCGEGGSAGGEAVHVGVVAVNQAVKSSDPGVNLVVQKAQKCFDALNIPVKTVKECVLYSQDPGHGGEDD